MLQLRIPHVATKTWHSQIKINKNPFKKEKPEAQWFLRLAKCCRASMKQSLDFTWESAQKLLPPNIAYGSSSGSGQSTETRSVKTLSKDAQGRVTGHLLSQRPFGICHTRSFSFSLGPCLWVSPWHVVRQTMGSGAIEVIFWNLWDAVLWHKGI